MATKVAKQRRDIGEFAKEVRDYRRANKLTQTELADMVGVDYATINRWENARNRPQQAKIDILEALMGSSTPIQKPTTVRFVQIAANNERMFGLDRSGNVYGWRDQPDGWEPLSMTILPQKKNE